MPSFSDLPAELITAITGHLDTKSALALAATTHSKYTLLNEAIYAHHIHNEKRGYSPLWWAVEDRYSSRHRLRTAQRALSLGAEVDASMRHRARIYKQPLYEAVLRKNVKMVALLLSYGADPSLCGERDTALHAAAAEGETEILRLLLQSDQSVPKDEEQRNDTQQTLDTSTRRTGRPARLPNFRSSKGSTPLHDAASGGRDECIRLLLKFGAIIDSRDTIGNTPLHRAVNAGRLSTVQLLISSGANPYALTNDGKDIFVLALQQLPRTAPDNTELMRFIRILFMSPPATLLSTIEGGSGTLLLRKRREKYTLPADRVYLMLADRSKLSKGAVEFLVDVGISVDARSSQSGITALAHYAGQKISQWSYVGVLPGQDALDAITTLLDAGADVNARDKSGGRTPLLRAIHASSVQVVRVLLERGADISARDSKGHGALTYATRNADILRVLLEHDRQPDGKPHVDILAQMEEVDNDKRTPLLNVLTYTSGMAPSAAAAELLLDSGANPNARDQHGQPALSIAVKNISMLSLIPRFAERGANLEVRDSDGRTPLIATTAMGYADGTRLLLEAGAEIDAVGRHGETALTKACQEGKEDIVKMLLEKGASLELAFKGDPMLLSYCKARRQNAGGFATSFHESYEAVVRLLLDHGAEKWENEDVMEEREAMMESLL